MDSYLDINNNYFGVRHYKVHVTKEKIKPLRFITSVISYAIFIWLLLIGITSITFIITKSFSYYILNLFLYQ